MSALRVNGERLLADLKALAAIGRNGAGVRRTAFSQEDVDARLWLAGKFREAGLEAGFDAVGNVFGRTPGVEKALLVGSHTDTVPTGGWLDGALGVVYALEIARCLKEQGALDVIGVDVVSFSDEEGTYLSWLGSRSVCGEITEAAIDGARNPAGEPLRDALARLPAPFGPKLRLDRYIGYFETHIEQGPVLEQTGNAVAVVTSIVGIRNHVVRFRGRADHAGTTPMNMREDAGLQMFDFVEHFRRGLQRVCSADSVWVFGNILMQPGASNVVPSSCEILVQYRDPDSDVLLAMDAAMQAALDHVAATHNLPSQVHTIMRTEPVRLDAGLGEEIMVAAAQTGASAIRMPSGAGHDAAAIGKHIPALMMFVPSIGGRSHTPEEDTSEADIVAGADVALNAVQRLIAPRQSQP